ncbi:PD-(D/E)XK nuclease family protein [Paenibacillus alginolyticus]|uniref:RecB family exonuclease n=1 Tax=Paenibacillus alginolyticus TaxID=59839 RepID=UPI000408AD0C|nr:PD-(D/E)XK nuclease family protein [Paenibacillus alginolyticus]MCY9665823.1 PD-(D/E)XK nuclease family protein [Paenibacillus alginolyticus]
MSTKVYSYSRLKTFEDCMRMGYHKYIEGRPDPSGLSAIIGKIFHSAFSKVINEGLSPDDSVMSSIYEHGGLPEGERAYDLVRMTEYTFRRISEVQGEFSDITSETHLRIEIAPGIFVQAYLDLIIEDPANDEVIIADLKTSWAPFEASSTRQLPLYGLLFKEMRGGFVPAAFRGLLIFTRHVNADSEITFTDELLEETREWVVRMVQNVQAAGTDINNFPMTDDRRTCEHCPFASLCAAGYVNDIPGDGVPKDDVEAALIGQYLLFQEQALKRMKEGLKAYVKSTNTPIDLPMGRWEFKQSEPTPKIMIEVLRQFADDHGLNADQVITTDSKKVKEWVESDVTGFLKSQATYMNPRSTFTFSDRKEENIDLCVGV